VKKFLKFICWVVFILFILLIFVFVTANGGFGDKVEYYYLKGLYLIVNPQNKPVAEIIIDLKKDDEFIKKTSQPEGCLSSFAWWTSYEERKEKGYLGLQTVIPANPFEYFNVKIILEESIVVIPNAKVIRIHFKDYRNSEYRIKNPELNRIDSVQIDCLEGQPVLENGRVLKRKKDYNFAFAQHEKITSIFTELGFSRDVNADEMQKDIMNNRLIESDKIRFMEYKNWIKDNFEFTLMLQAYDKEYVNSIYINPKDRLISGNGNK